MYVDGCGRANTQIRGRRDGIVRDGVVEHRFYFCILCRSSSSSQLIVTTTAMNVILTRPTRTTAATTTTSKNRAQKPFNWGISQMDPFRIRSDVKIHNNNDKYSKKIIFNNLNELLLCAEIVYLRLYTKTSAQINP